MRQLLLSRLRSPDQLEDRDQGAGIILGPFAFVTAVLMVRRRAGFTKASLPYILN
jgi:hypothetical protein